MFDTKDVLDRYSESLYALLSLGGIYFIFSDANTVAMLLLALSGSARSNGALNAGYFCFQALKLAYDAIIHKKNHIVRSHYLCLITCCYKYY